MGDLPVIVGQRNLTVAMPEDGTIGGLLAALSESLGDAFTARVFSGPDKLQHTMLVFVNGENIADCGGFAAKLGDGDVELVMLPMFGGG